MRGLWDWGGARGLALLKQCASIRFTDHFTDRLARSRYPMIGLTVVSGLALGIGIRHWPTAEAHLGEVPFTHRWVAIQNGIQPKVAAVTEAPELSLPAPDPLPEPRAGMRLAALDPDTRSLTYERTLADTGVPQGKGYIMYFNSPTHWTPVPLPPHIETARVPHNNNIRAEIEQAAMLFDVDVRMMKAFARIESGFRPKATTGRYKCLFQLSDWEFKRYWQGDIYDIRDCAMAAARKLATEAAQFEKDIGRPATATEIYCIHQQGYQGCSFHYDAPHQLAWKNMFLTKEGQEKGEAWARKAIWGNVPSDIKNSIKGGVEALTSGEFIAIWHERVERFIARKVEPPSHYVESKSKPSKLAAGKKKAKTATLSGKKKSKTKVAAAR